MQSAPPARSRILRALMEEDAAQNWFTPAPDSELVARDFTNDSAGKWGNEGSELSSRTMSANVRNAH